MAAPPSLRRRRNAKAPSSSSSSRNSGSGGSGSKKKKTASSSSSSKRTHGGTAHERRRFVFAAAAAVGLFLLASLLLRRSAWDMPGSRSDDEDDGEGALQLALQLQNDPVLNKTHWYLTTFVCSGFAASSSAAEDNEDRGGGYCHPDLVPVPQRRTHRARGGSDGGIKSGETILILPRSQQIWDLDALRDPWIRRVLLRWDDDDEENGDDDGGANTKRWRSPRHAGTSNPLDSGAYLAAYLVRRLKVAIGSWWRCNNSPLPPTSVSGETTEEVGSSEKDPMLPYLELLPNHTALATYHPTLWPSSDLDGLLGKHTSSRQLVQAYKTMMDAEYDVFSASSVSSSSSNGGEKNEFARCISREEYRTMRIHVMSRSFGPGPPGPEEEMTSPSLLPSSFESVSDSESMSLDEELDLYQTLGGINLTKGCRAMSPILDTWDHHAQPNVEWRYDRTKRAFVVKTIAPASFSSSSRSKEIIAIPSGHDVMVSYGKYTDAHLFAKFGFNNGDGSGHVQVNLGSWHRMLDVGLGQQFSYLPFDYDPSRSRSKKIEDGGAAAALSGSVRALLAAQRRELTRYLQFDDGYDECIRPPSLSTKHHSSVSEDDDDSSSSSSVAWELKQLKFRHLQRIANDPDRWNVLLPPRRSDSKPAKSSNLPIAFDAPRKFDLTKKGSGGGPLFDMSKVASTCRLLTLTEHDFDGRAVEVLSEALLRSSPSSSSSSDDDEFKPRPFFTVERQSDTLEYRTLLCLARLAGVALSRYPSTAAKDAASMPDLTVRDFGGREWTATHVRLGELHGLEAVGALAVSFARTMRDRAAEELGIPKKKKDSDRHPLLSMRDKPCPQEYLAPLLVVG